MITPAILKLIVMKTISNRKHKITRARPPEHSKTAQNQGQASFSAITNKVKKKLPNIKYS